jgi:tetratricopeptide (TPR) repeat protein
MTTRSQLLRRSTAAALVGLFASASTAPAQDETDPTDATVPAMATEAINADGISQVELSIWRTPAFRRRFAESFAAEMPVEPPLDGRDLTVMTDAMDLMAANRIDEALALLGKNRSARASAALDFMAGNLLYVQGRLDEAADALEFAVGKFPNFRRAWMRLGDLEARRGNDALAVAALGKACELGACDPFTMGLLAISQARLGNLIAAETAYRRAILLDSTTFQWRIGLADILAAQARHPEAIAMYEKLVADRPEDASIWRRLGQARLDAGRPDEAAQDLEVVRVLGVMDPAVERELAEIYLERGLATLAVERQLAATGMDGDAGPALQAGRRLATAGEIAAVESMLAALRGDEASFDDEVRAEFGRLESLLAARRGEDADQLAALEALVDRDPLDGEAIIQLGRYHARQPDGLERAEFWFERAEGLPAFEVEARIRHAEALVAAGRYPQAISLLKQAQSLRPDDDVKAYLDEIEGYARNR